MGNRWIESLSSVIEWIGKLLYRPFEMVLGRKSSMKSYSAKEAARLIGKMHYTVREWCRLGRMRAVVRRSGDRTYWEISHEELERYRRRGLRPGDE